MPISFDPSPFEMTLAHGDVARRKHDLATAERHYREALALAPPGSTYFARAATKLGRLAETSGRIQESERFYRQALDIYSNTVGDEYFDLALAEDRVHA